MIMSILQDDNDNEMKKHTTYTIKTFNYNSLMVQKIHFLHMQGVLFHFLSSVINSEILSIVLIPYRMCSLADSTLDSPAVNRSSNSDSGKILMSENLRLYTTSLVVMC